MAREYVKPPRGVGISPIETQLGPAGIMVRRDAGHQWMQLNGPGRLPDWAIRELISIDPFIDYGSHNKDAVVSYGLTSAGYDIRVGYRFKVFTNLWSGIVSPRGIPKKCFAEFDLTPDQKVLHDWSKNVPFRCNTCGVLASHDNVGQVCQTRLVDVPKEIQIPPNSFALAETLETLWIPRNVDCLCLGKSTYARCGIIVNFTPFEPGWWGKVTVEISNSTPNPVEILCGQGIGQAKYDLMAGMPERPYGEKAGAKYQGQGGMAGPNEN